MVAILKKNFQLCAGPQCSICHGYFVELVGGEVRMDLDETEMKITIMALQDCPNEALYISWPEPDLTRFRTFPGMFGIECLMKNTMT